MFVRLLLKCNSGDLASARLWLHTFLGGSILRNRTHGTTGMYLLRSQLGQFVCQ